MDKVNGIDLEFTFKKRGHSPDTSRLRSKRNKILQPNKNRIVGRGRDSERLQEYPPSQKGQKEIERINIVMYNRFFHYCEGLGTMPRKKCNEKIHESWFIASSDSESQVSQLTKTKNARQTT